MSTANMKCILDGGVLWLEGRRVFLFSDGETVWVQSPMDRAFGMPPLIKVITPSEDEIKAFVPGNTYQMAVLFPWSEDVISGEFEYADSAKGALSGAVNREHD